MCVGEPMVVVATDGLIGTCVRAGDQATEIVDLALVGQVEPGTHVLVFLGSAREVLSPERADEITRAISGLRSLMDGGSLGDAFADLEARPPELPPHLKEQLKTLHGSDSAAPSGAPKEPAS